MIPLDLDAIGADFYGGNCHKWLLAPTGSGFLISARQRRSPAAVAGELGLAARPRPARRARRIRLDAADSLLEFEGTRDICPWLAVPAAIDFQRQLGFEIIRRHNEDLVQLCANASPASRLSLATPPHPDLHGFLTAFRLPRT